MECPWITELVTYVEHILSLIGRLQLSAESVMKIVCHCLPFMGLVGMFSLRNHHIEKYVREGTKSAG